MVCGFGKFSHVVDPCRCIAYALSDERQDIVYTFMCQHIVDDDVEYRVSQDKCQGACSGSDPLQQRNLCCHADPSRCLADLLGSSSVSDVMALLAVNDVLALES